MKLSEDKGAAYLKWVSGRGSSSEKQFKNKYVALRKRLKKLVIQRQIDYWDDLSKEIEEAVKQHDPGTAYAMIRRLKGGKPQIEHMPILDKQGQLLLNASDRLVRFREFFNDLLNVNSMIDQSAIDNIKPATIPVLEKVRQEKPPTLLEVQTALRQMRSLGAWCRPGSAPAPSCSASSRPTSRRGGSSRECADSPADRRSRDACHARAAGSGAARDRARAIRRGRR